VTIRVSQMDEPLAHSIAEHVKSEGDGDHERGPGFKEL
jgi:hypothetical protein